MGSRCKNCQYATFGSYDSLSDVCDGCMSDPDTGWGGFTDHRAGRHFNNEEEQNDYYKNEFDDESDELDDEW